MANYDLPLKHYLLFTPEQLSKIDFTDPDLEKKMKGGVIVSVDLRYPPSAQLKTMQLPLAIEKRQIHIHELSEQQQESVMSSCPKILTHKRLILSHMDKTAYVLDSRILRFYLSQGMEIKKINAGFTFDTSPDIFRNFMALNARLRKEA